MVYAAFTERSIGMEEGTKTSNRYRSLLIGFLILDLIAFTLLAIAYFWNGDIGDQEIKYEDAELVFDDLSGQKVIPSGGRDLSENRWRYGRRLWRGGNCTGRDLLSL